MRFMIYIRSRSYRLSQMVTCSTSWSCSMQFLLLLELYVHTIATCDHVLCPRQIEQSGLRCVCSLVRRAYRWWDNRTQLRSEHHTNFFVLFVVCGLLARCTTTPIQWSSTIHPSLATSLPLPLVFASSPPPHAYNRMVSFSFRVSCLHLTCVLDNRKMNAAVHLVCLCRLAT